MGSQADQRELRVEGVDDEHTILHLLIRHGIPYAQKPAPPNLPLIMSSKDGIEKMLDGMQTAVSLSTGRPIGFVFDADSPLANRWSAVRDRLRSADVVTPDRPPLEGFRGQSARYRTTVGVWLMPDNEHDGALEDFLTTLIHENDLLIRPAKTAANRAKDEFGARFAETDRLKASIHTWLAWQERPGVPYGTAINAQYFRYDSPAALRFVAWFKALYGLD